MNSGLNYPSSRTNSIRSAIATVAVVVSFAGCGESAKSPTNDSTAAKAKAASKGPRVVVLRYQVGSDSTEQREKGFIETLKKEFPQITIISDEQYSGATREGALAKAENLLTRFGESIDGWFCPCEPVTNGTLQALRQRNMQGKVKVVGFDAGAEVVNALRDGEIHGLILQDPVEMGYRGVKRAVEKLEGKTIAKKESTGEYVVTKENMDDPKMKLLHSPDLDPWLSAPAIAEDKKYTIAVIPKGTLHEFWKSIHAGAIKAERELGNVKIIWKGPDREDDREQQIQVVENFINRKVSAMVLAPLDKTALVAPAERAVAASIPVIVIDSGVESDKIDAYVATDNYNGGALAARRLGQLLTKSE